MAPEGYTYKEYKVVPTTAKTVNYHKLVEILCSKDESLMEENAWIWDGHNYFLDGKVHLNDSSIANHVQFTSFPRSGNSFLRRLIENVTGIETGSTMPPVLACIFPIIGMKGETHKDDNIWICKSHYPMIAPADAKTPPFLANKTFMVVRNPFDVIHSYTQLMNTFTHDAVVEFDYL